MGARREITTVVLESLLLLGLLVVLARRTALRALLADLPRTRHWLLVGLVGALLAAHRGGRNHLTYPFVQWSMYTTSFAGTRYLDYTAVREDGVEIRFPITDVYPTVGRNIVWKVTELMRVGMGATPGPRREAALAQLDTILRAYGRRYNQGRPAALCPRLLWLLCGTSDKGAVMSRRSAPRQGRRRPGLATHRSCCLV